MSYTVRLPKQHCPLCAFDGNVSNGCLTSALCNALPRHNILTHM